MRLDDRALQRAGGDAQPCHDDAGRRRALGWPGGGRPPRLTDVREVELRDAAAELGVAFLETFDYPDGALEKVAEIEAVRERFLGDIVRCLRSHRPQVVVTFGPEGGYGHPDHKVVSRMTVQAFARSGDPSAYEFEALALGACPGHPASSTSRRRPRRRSNRSSCRRSCRSRLESPSRVSRKRNCAPSPITARKRRSGNRYACSSKPRAASKSSPWLVAPLIYQRMTSLPESSRHLPKLSPVAWGRTARPSSNGPASPRSRARAKAGSGTYRGGRRRRLPGRPAARH